MEGRKNSFLSDLGVCISWLLLLVLLSTVLHLVPFINIVLVAPSFKSGAGNGPAHSLVNQENPPLAVPCSG